MKKSLTLLALAFGISTGIAQELKSKKEEMILPEAGDWSLGIDANPFLNYAGNFFGKTTNNVAPTWNFLTSVQTITGKYFADVTTAYRGQLRIGMNSSTARNMTSDRAAQNTTVFPQPYPMKENTWKNSNTAFGLSGGLEMRRGKTRLQGYYGGELGFYLSNSKDVFTYGNALSTSTTAPVSVSAADAFTGSNNIESNPGQYIQGVAAGQDARILERKNGSTFSFGIRGFIGAEYFILPKISIGGEFGWGIGLSSVGKTETTYETIGFNGTNNNPGTATVEGAKQGGLSIDTDNTNGVWGPTGSLRLNLHF